MVEVKINRARNSMMIVFSDVVDRQQAEEAYSRVEKEVVKLKSGFKVLTDLSSLERMDLDACSGIQKVMQLCNQAGVAKIVRIIPDPDKDIGFNIMSLFSYSSEVNIVTYRSTEEALKKSFLGDFD